MSEKCPFHGRYISMTPQLVEVFPVGSNNCALIMTTARRSPCWMEVAEKREPDWSQCPRNPEFRIEAMSVADVTDGSPYDRCRQEFRHTALLHAARAEQ